MWQLSVKVVQAAIFIAVVVAFLGNNHEGISGLAIGAVALVVVMIVTVIPWLIFMMIKDGLSRLKARRVKPGVLDLLDDGIARRRISLNSRPRIGK